MVCRLIDWNEWIVEKSLHGDVERSQGSRRLSIEDRPQTTDSRASIAD